MQFRSRYDGKLVLTKGPITTERPIKRGDAVSFSAKTIQHFGEDIKEKVSRGMLAALDDEARAFLDPSKSPAPASSHASALAAETKPEKAPDEVEPEPSEGSPKPKFGKKS
jgi:hypothetical protein